MHRKSYRRVHFKRRELWIAVVGVFLVGAFECVCVTGVTVYVALDKGTMECKTKSRMGGVQVQRRQTCGRFLCILLIAVDCV